MTSDSTDLSEILSNQRNQKSIIFVLVWILVDFGFFLHLVPLFGGLAVWRTLFVFGLSGVAYNIDRPDGSNFGHVTSHVPESS